MGAVRSSGYIALGQVTACLTVLDVACNRCDRRCRLNIARLMAEHGPQLPGPKLRYMAVANVRPIALCPVLDRGKSAGWTKHCACRLKVQNDVEPGR